MKVGSSIFIACISIGWSVLSTHAFGVVEEGGDPSLEIEDPVAFELGNDRKCNQVLGVVKSETVRLAGRKLLENFLDAKLLERSLDIILLPAVGDFEVVKICASCKDHHDWYFTLSGSKEFPGYHGEYCSSNTAGYEVPYSTLAFIPLDKSGSIPYRKKLRMFLSMASNRVDPQLAPTKAFPVESLTKYLNGNTINNNNATSYFLYTYLPSMVAASAGSVAFIPDPAGTGESQDQVDRSMFHKFNYDRVAAISYLALKRYIMERTSQCTLLDTVATVHGANDGAFGALYATQILQRFEVRVVGSFVQGGALNLEKWLQQSLYDADKFADNEIAREWMQLAAYTFSGNIEGIRNTGSGSYLAADEFRIALADKFAPIQGTRGDSAFQFPRNPADMMSESIRNILSERVTSPCADKFDSILCSVILEASAYQVMLGQTDRKWIYPLHTCYSSADEILSLNQLEDVKFDSDQQLQELWTRYGGPIAFNGLSPEIATDHASTLLLCAVEPALFYTLQGHRPDDEEDWPNRQVGLTANENFWCEGPDLTNEPTPTPINTGGDGTPAMGSGGGGGDGAPVELPIDTPVQNTNPDAEDGGSGDSASSANAEHFITMYFVSVSGILLSLTLL